MASGKKKTKGEKLPRIRPERNLQNFILILVVVIFAVSVIWSEPISRIFTGLNIKNEVVITPSATTLPGTPTPLPAEYLSEPNQTSGILLGVVLLAVIIIAGTLGVIFRSRV
jgi:CDP-diglyceride synthetase